MEQVGKMGLPFEGFSSVWGHVGRVGDTLLIVMRWTGAVDGSVGKSKSPRCGDDCVANSACKQPWPYD
eukprot:1391723-Amphidinium_carterae.1